MALALTGRVSASAWHPPCRSTYHPFRTEGVESRWSLTSRSAREKRPYSCCGASVPKISNNLVPALAKRKTYSVKPQLIGSAGSLNALTQVAGARSFFVPPSRSSSCRSNHQGLSLRLLPVACQRRSAEDAIGTTDIPGFVTQHSRCTACSESGSPRRLPASVTGWRAVGRSKGSRDCRQPKVMMVRCNSCTALTAVPNSRKKHSITWKGTGARARYGSATPPIDNCNSTSTAN